MLKLRCDVCGNIIEKPEQGWVEWIDRIVSGERRAKGLRLTGAAKNISAGHTKKRYYKIDERR